MEGPTQYAVHSAAKLATIVMHQSSTDVDSDKDEDSDHEDDALSALNSDFARLTIKPDDGRFFGRSSGIMVLQAAFHLKRDVTSGGVGPLTDGFWNKKRPEFWAPQPVSHILWHPCVRL